MGGGWQTSASPHATLISGGNSGSSTAGTNSTPLAIGGSQSILRATSPQCQRCLYNPFLLGFGTALSKGHAMPSHRVLLLGGHGKVSMHLTPLLLAKSWNVTSVVRNPDHKDEILQLGRGKPGKIDVLVESLDDVKSDEEAQKVLDQVQPDVVVWSAGAGGKGGPSRTYAVDQDAAKHYISSSLGTPSVTKFLMVSYIASRKGRAPWWTDEDWASAQHVNSQVLPTYFKAKVEADEHLAALAKKRLDGGDSTFQSINLRPGTLTDAPATGKVMLGKTPARGSISREEVAKVAAALLERDDTRGWYDLIAGEDDIGAAIDKLVREGHDGMAGEDMERIYARAT